MRMTSSQPAATLDIRPHPVVRDALKTSMCANSIGDQGIDQHLGIGTMAESQGKQRTEHGASRGPIWPQAQSMQVTAAGEDVRRC